MFRIKNANGETVIRFNEYGEWEFSIDNTGYVDLLTQDDLDQGKVFGGKPIKKFSTHERAVEVVKDIAQAIMDAQQGVGPKFYILPEE